MRNHTELHIKNFSKISFLVLMLFLLFACKNTSMDGMFEDYNKKFLPSEDTFWTVEYVTKATMDFEHYEMDAEFRVSKDTGLFIIGAPRDADSYIWFLDGKIISGNQVLELKIKVEKPNGFGGVDTSGSIPLGAHSLKLKSTKSGKTKEWGMNLIIE